MSSDKLTKETVNFIKTTFTPTDNKNANKLRAENYAKSVNMDERNTKAAIIMATEGREAAVKAMFTGDNGETLSYSEMRSRYG